MHNMINTGFFGSDSNKKKKTENKIKRKKTRHPAVVANQPVIVDNHKLQMIVSGGISTTRRPLKSTTQAKSTTELKTEQTFDTTRITTSVTTPIIAKTTTTAIPAKSETVSYENYLKNLFNLRKEKRLFIYLILLTFRWQHYFLLEINIGRSVGLLCDDKTKMALVYNKVGSRLPALFSDMSENV